MIGPRTFSIGQASHLHSNGSASSDANATPGGISSIFFSEFDTVAGPKITYEVPDTGRFMATGIFEQINSYIIPKPELAFKQMTITCSAFKVVGYAIQIDNTKYPRNALIFNLCFVFDAKVNVHPYEPIVKKVGEYLRTVEIETGYLFQKESKSDLPQLMLKLLTELNGIGRCSTEINRSNSLFLKLVTPDKLLTTTVHEYDVPVLLADPASLNGLDNDLTTRQIVPLIDGKRSVHDISGTVDADGDLVKACIQNMVFYKIAQVVPAFHHSNIYCVLPAFQQFVFSSVQQKECMDYVVRDEGDKPSLRDVMILYGDMQHGITVRNLLARHHSVASKIDEKKLCDFGVMNGFLRRVHKYPVYLRYNQAIARGQSIQRSFNGANHTEEIKIKHDITLESLDEKIEQDQLIVVCWK